MGNFYTFVWYLIAKLDSRVPTRLVPLTLELPHARRLRYRTYQPSRTVYPLRAAYPLRAVYPLRA
ncbi:MAG: hypothetical protein ACI9TP_002419, partial [Candidatus Azotimanducaceae bacterium]